MSTSVYSVFPYEHAKFHIKVETKQIQLWKHQLLFCHTKRDLLPEVVFGYTTCQIYHNLILTWRPFLIFACTVTSLYSILYYYNTLLVYIGMTLPSDDVLK